MISATSTYYNDNNHFCCQVLRARIADGNLPRGHVDERDIRDVHAADFVHCSHAHLFAGIGAFPLGMQWANFPSHIRTITGGFPCQDISLAGKGAGIEGEKSGIWKEMYRLIQETIDCNMGYHYILLENVAALTHRGIDHVLADLAQTRYDAEWVCLRASDFGAPHRRERVFIVAYPSIQGLPSRRLSGCTSDATQIATGMESESQRCSTMARLNTTRQQECNASRCNLTLGQDTSTRQSQPCLGRGVDGISTGMDTDRWPARIGRGQYDWEPPRVITTRERYRVDRLKALGNAIVPQCVWYVAQCVKQHYDSLWSVEQGGER